MIQRHIAIGGLLLPQIGAWEFSELAGMITGRRDGAPGFLQILHVTQDTLPQPVTHDFCLSVLMFMIKPDGEPVDRVMMESVCGPYGAATFVRGARPRNGAPPHAGAGARPGEGGDVLRAWYCRRPPGLIYAVYSCPAELARGPAYEHAKVQCARIMSEVLFDRIGWGATAEDDPLTKVLHDNFDRIEHER